ncbi:MAG: adenosylcobinamide-GDP ribazoletransferase [Xanthobacteraceae bacterium]
MTIDKAWLKERGADLKASLLFLTRLRYGPATPVSGAAVAAAAWAFPLVGILVGLIGALVYALAFRAGLPAWPAAALAVAATMAVTGCLHEDGLADTTDGFGGGNSRERKLDIMRDSRIGTYGVCALALSILLRVSVLASLAAPALVVPALIAAHGAARAIVPAFMTFVRPARSDGLSAAAGQPPRESAAVAIILGILILVLCLGFWAGLAALILLAIVAALLAWLSVSQIDGQTGDVLGAVEQVGEVVILLVALG